MRAFTIAIAFRDIGTATLVNLTWAIANATCVQCTHTIVYIIANAIRVGICLACASAHAQCIYVFTGTVIRCCRRIVVARCFIRATQYVGQVVRGIVGSAQLVVGHPRSIAPLDVPIARYMSGISFGIVRGGKLPQEHHTIFACVREGVRARRDIPASAYCTLTEDEAVSEIEFGEGSGHPDRRDRRIVTGL